MTVNGKLIMNQVSDAKGKWCDGLAETQRVHVQYTLIGLMVVEKIVWSQLGEDFGYHLSWQEVRVASTPWTTIYKHCAWPQVCFQLFHRDINLWTLFFENLFVEKQAAVISSHFDSLTIDSAIESGLKSCRGSPESINQIGQYVWEPIDEDHILSIKNKASALTPAIRLATVLSLEALETIALSH